MPVACDHLPGPSLALSNSRVDRTRPRLTLCSEVVPSASRGRESRCLSASAVVFAPQDWYLLVPNAIGAVLAAIQTMLCAAFGKFSGGEAK